MYATSTLPLARAPISPVPPPITHMIGPDSAMNTAVHSIIGTASIRLVSA